MSKDLITAEQVRAIETIAKHASSSKYFEKLGGEAGLFCIAMYAQELGLPPLQSLFGGMNSIQGKIELSPRLMNAMIRKAGHKIEVLKCDISGCTLKGTRADTQECLTVTYTIEDAKRAQIFREGGPWTKYPDDMCFKSALSKLARRLFADIISTAYVEGEIAEESTQKRAQERPRAEEKIEEAVIDIPKIPLELIAKGDAQALELACSDDPEYRNRLLVSCARKYNLPMENFESLPKEALEPVWNMIKKYQAKKKNKEESYPEAQE